MHAYEPELPAIVAAAMLQCCSIRFPALVYTATKRCYAEQNTPVCLLGPLELVHTISYYFVLFERGVGRVLWNILRSARSCTTTHFILKSPTVDYGRR